MTRTPRKRNTRLEQARQDKGLSRSQLAVLVNAYVLDHHGQRRATDQRHVGKWERGELRPDAVSREALLAVLDASGPDDIGCAPPTRATVEQVNRKDFLRGAAALTSSALLRVPWQHTSSDTGIDDDPLNLVAVPTRAYRAGEAHTHTATLAPAVTAHLRMATAMLGHRPSPVQHAALAELNGLAAWLAADAGDDATARRRYAAAVDHAERSGHTLLTAYMIASQGHHTIESGFPRAGLDQLDRAALTLGSPAPATAHAWLQSLYAVGHARAGHRKLALSALRAAETHTARQRGDTVWPFVFPFDLAKAARYRSAALGRLGDIRAADAAWTVARPALKAPKVHALALAHHAETLAVAGRIAESGHTATTALTLAGEYGSARTITTVRRLRERLPARTGDLAGLDAALTALDRATTA
ncbi:helix-turn-helix transcriptional regulator [Saccharothrix sp.]|uniref:helix-turn-helix domain-containing protein n=1 Tax=Saccharothrix sp. TaxID=1873460 RepID=UPI0028120909|nr:helix-turn-helix transcriptional regulator [Saccharothrix sp.]